MASDLSVVRAFAPHLKFHEHETVFPCSIEQILPSSTLKRRNWSAERKIPYGTWCPEGVSSVEFQDSLYMAYVKPDDQLPYLRRSPDGKDWMSPVLKFAERKSVGPPSLVVYNERLWLFCVDPVSFELFIRSTANGREWEGPRRAGVVKALAPPSFSVIEGALMAVFTGTLGNRLYHATSGNGYTWGDVTEISGHKSSNIAATTFHGKPYLIYARDDNTGNLLSVPYDQKWGSSHRMRKIVSSEFSLCTNWIDNKEWLVLFYRDRMDSKTYCVRSSDGKEWQDSHTLPFQCGRKVKASLCDFADGVTMIYSAVDSPCTQMIASSRMTSWGARKAIRSPTQNDLLHCGSDPDWYLELNDDLQNIKPQGAHHVPRPVYFVWNASEDILRITYVFLFVAKPSATVRYDQNGKHFDAILATNAQRIVDIKRFTIILRITQPGSITLDNLEVLSGLFSTTSSEIAYPGKDLDLINGTHTEISVALGSHSFYNASRVAEPIPICEISACVQVVDFISDIPSWIPEDFIEIGLDSHRVPVGKEVWVSFCGGLGDDKMATYSQATTLDDKGLEKIGDELVRVVNDTTKRHGLYASGAVGLGSRDWVKSSVVGEPESKAKSWFQSMKDKRSVLSGVGNVLGVSGAGRGV
ncbi:hypothetical protein EX30DRAFT_398980 [Ascodesmis nigricans]|uniref:Fucose-specific lectin n=1 Tax=Ascodesmis nigricans TaxID=341454 RepID=A0A4S2MNL5_9PEZI|nr:hypothetical protein EX30DRAFT_398980 [Ascodesmis nigricans]